MIKRDWVRRYNEPPVQKDTLMVLQSWDTASKGGPENDFSVCTTWIYRDKNSFFWSTSIARASTTRR